MNRRVFDDERLADWVDDQLDGVQRERFEAELRVNPELRRAAEEYRRTVDAVRSALREGESVSAGFADRVMQGVARAERARRFRLVPLLGSAIAAALLAGLWLFVREFATTTSVEREVARLPRAERSEVDAEGRGNAKTEPTDAEAAAESTSAPVRLEGTGADESAQAFRRQTTEPTAKPEGKVRASNQPEGDKSADDLQGLATGAASPNTLHPGSARVVREGQAELAKDRDQGLQGGAVDERKRSEQLVTEGLSRDSVPPVTTTTADETRLKELADALRPPGLATAGSPPASTPGAPTPDLSAALGFFVDQPGLPDAGSLVYLVELPTVPIADPALDSATRADGRADAFAAWSMNFVQKPVEELGRQTANVLPPEILRLQVERPRLQDGSPEPQAAVDPSRSNFQGTELNFGMTLRSLEGAYVPEPGDQVFRLDGDVQQNGEYLRAFAPLVQSQNGRILVQRAFGLVAQVLDEKDLGKAAGTKAPDADRREDHAASPPAEKAPSSRGRGAPPAGAPAVKRAPEDERIQQDAETKPDQFRKPAPPAQDQLGSTWIVLRRRSTPPPAGPAAPPAQKPADTPPIRR